MSLSKDEQVIISAAFCTSTSLFACEKHGTRLFSQSGNVERRHKSHCQIVMKQIENQPSLLGRVLKFFPFRRKSSKVVVVNTENEVPKPTKHDWAVLVEEFEIRAKMNEPASKPPPPGVELKNEIDNKKLSLYPLVEIAAMAALTAMMWNIGRLLRLDSVLLTFYPLPMFYVTLRWGVKKGVTVLQASLFMIGLYMGPLFSLFYLFNTGFMSLVMSRLMYRRWSCASTVALAGLAKGVGLALQFTFISGVVRENAWKFIGYQVKDMVDKMVGFVFWVTRQTGLAPSPSMFQIQCVIAVVLVFHSIIHVFCTYLTASVILDRIADSGVPFERRVRLPNFLVYVKNKTIEAEESQIY